jgi:hypothetical protein
MNSKYLQKYFKYKNKYLQLKNKIGGASVVFTEEMGIEIERSIKQIFPTAKININNLNTQVIIKCIDILKSYRNIIGDHIDFTIIYNDKIYIDTLLKCNQLSGHRNLEKIIELGKILKNITNINKISLSDASDIILDGCNFSLSKLYILMYGISWYNKHGFISMSHDSEVENNKKICKLKLIDFLEKTTDNQFNYRKITMFNEIKFIRDSKNLSNNNIKLLRPIQKRIIKKYTNVKNNLENYQELKIIEFEKEKRDFIKECCDLFNNIITNIGNPNNIKELSFDSQISLIIERIYNYTRTNNLDCNSDEIKFLIKIIYISDYVIIYSIYFLDYQL